MSCWRTAKCETIKNIEEGYMMSALDKMGFSVDWDKKTVNGAYRSDGSRSVSCVLVSKENGKPVEIGMNISEREDGTNNIEVVADWYGKQYKDATEFLKKFTLEYNTARVIDVMGNSRFYVEDEVEVENGKRQLTFVRRAA